MTPHPLTCTHDWQDKPQLVIGEQGIYHAETVCSICGVTLAEWRWYEDEMADRLADDERREAELTAMAWEHPLREP